MKIGVVDYGSGNLASVLNAFRFVGADVELARGDFGRFGKLVLPGVGAFGSAMETLGAERADEIAKFAQSGRYLLGICLGMQLLFERSSEFGSHAGLGLLKGSVEKFDATRLNGLKIPQMGWNKCVITRDDALFRGVADLPSLRDLAKQGRGNPLTQSVQVHHCEQTQSAQRGNLSTADSSSLRDLAKQGRGNPLTQSVQVHHCEQTQSAQRGNLSTADSSSLRDLAKQGRGNLSGADSKFYLYFVHSYHAICDESLVLATCDYGYEFPAIVRKDNIYGIQPHPEKSHTLGLRILQNFVELK